MRSRPVLTAMMAVTLTLAPPTNRKTAAGDAPLTIRDGTLMREGKPYRGIGVNAFDLFARTLKNPSDASVHGSLERLARAKIPFARFMAGGYWPSEIDLYRSDAAAYFERMDRVVHAAEETGVGLIPSLFWHLPTMPDLAGEPLDAIANPSSQSRALMERYAREMVTRYRGSKAIWAWELGNELNLGADLPNAASHRPPVVPSLGTPAVRTERDEMTSDAMIAFAQSIGRVIRGLDPDRPLITGNALPRASAWHNTNKNSWAADTPDQFREVLLRDNPDPFNTLCVHVYDDGKGPWPGGATSLDDLFQYMARIATAARKPLIVGEFGVPADLHRDQAEAQLDAMLRAIDSSGVALAALWVYDFQGQDGTWNVTFENDRAWVLDRVARAHRSLRPPVAAPGPAR
jgi:hypothetical protein